jgi:multiple sugar transport system ATP-binding protein
MTLGTRVAVMRAGTVQQVDTPQALYRSPANLFVAAFIGSPSMNLVEAELDDGAIAFAGYRIPLALDRVPAGISSGRLIVGVRPQDLREPAPGSTVPTIEVEAAVVEELGSATHVLFTIEAPPVDVDAVRAATDEGERATLIATDRRALFTAEVSEGTVVRPGQRITLRLDTSRRHFFDLETAESLRRPLAAAIG